MIRMQRVLLVLALAGIGVIGGQKPAAAQVRALQQNNCTARCDCNDTSCTCYSTGGAGLKAHCPGTGTCTVDNCPPNPGVIALLPDGSASKTASQHVVLWATYTPGVALGHACSGTVLDRFWDKRAASLLRQQAVSIEI